jgi:hypothetical protein
MVTTKACEYDGFFSRPQTVPFFCAESSHIWEVGCNWEVPRWLYGPSTFEAFCPSLYRNKDDVSTDPERKKLEPLP